MSESGKATIVFRERSLREYFQAAADNTGPLRTPPSAAQLTLFDMSATLLYNQSVSPNSKGDSTLLTYAANHWWDHFVRIDIATASDDEVGSVATHLFKILNNHNNVAATMETRTRRTYQTLFSNTRESWTGIIKDWATRAVDVQSEHVTSEVKAWATSFDPADALRTIARGHVTNWYSDYSLDSGRPFSFAVDALTMVSSSLQTFDN